MKLIVDIDDELVETAKLAVQLDMADDYAKSIANGIPLPKGHGRLIDADELTNQLKTVANDEWNKQVGASKGLEDAIDIVDDAQTIVEAERSE